MSLIDRDDCCMPRCRQTAMLTYLGTPMCQQCWDKHCAAEDAKELDKWVSEGGSSHIPTPITPIRTLLDDFSD